MFRRLFQLALGLAAAVGWVFALVVVRSWPAIIISVIFTFIALYGDLMLGSLTSTWRYARLKRAGFRNACTYTLAQEGWPWGTRNFNEACLERTLERYDYPGDSRVLFPHIMAFTDDHDLQHEYVRDYEYEDAEGRETIQKFWVALAASSYPPDEADALVQQHGYEVALHAVENDLPFEYAKSLA